MADQQFAYYLGISTKTGLNIPTYLLCSSNKLLGIYSLIYLSSWIIVVPKLTWPELKAGFVEWSPVRKKNFWSESSSFCGFFDRSRLAEKKVIKNEIKVKNVFSAKVGSSFVGSFSLLGPRRLTFYFSFFARVEFFLGRKDFSLFWCNVQHKCKHVVIQNLDDCLPSLLETNLHF